MFLNIGLRERGDHGRTATNDLLSIIAIRTHTNTIVPFVLFPFCNQAGESNGLSDNVNTSSSSNRWKTKTTCLVIYIEIDRERERGGKERDRANAISSFLSTCYWPSFFA